MEFQNQSSLFSYIIEIIFYLNAGALLIWSFGAVETLREAYSQFFLAFFGFS